MANEGLWNTPEDLIRDLSLTSVDDPNNLGKIREALMARIKEVHPDSAGDNELASLEGTRETQRLNQALDWLEHYEQESKALVLVSQTALQKMVKAAITVRHDRNPALARRELFLESRGEIKETARPAKVSLAAISGILAVVWFVPERLLAHPFIAPYLSLPAVRLLYFSSVLVVIVSWIVVAVSEVLAKSTLRRWLDREVLDDNFRSFLYPAFNL